MASTNELMVNLDKKTRIIEQSLSPIKFKERTLRKSMQVLKVSAKDISSYASEYNHKNIDANGFWSFIRLIDKFADICIESLNMNNNRDYDPLIDDVSSLLVSYVSIVETLREATAKYDKNRNNNNIYSKRVVNTSDTSLSSSRSSTPTTGVSTCGMYNVAQKNIQLASTSLTVATSPTQLITDADTMIIAFRQFLELESKQRSLHMLGSFWLAPSMKKSQSIVTAIMALFARLPLSVLSLFDRSYRGSLITLCQHRATREYPFAIWNLSELEISKFITKYILNKESKLTGLNISNIQIMRQNTYLIPSDGGRIKINNNSNNAEVRNQLERSSSWLSISYAERLSKQLDAKSKVKCLYIKPNNYDPSKLRDNTVILHCHGGGLIAQTPDSHLSYLSEWCNKLETPIISVDYVTNQGLFPALQDVLDVYLWLTSNSLNVELTLGYIPKRVILVGDSAGGSLHLTLCFVIADINKLMMYQEEDPELIQLPSGFLAVYTGFRTPGTSPSRMLMSMIDPILSTGTILATSEQTEEEFNESILTTLSTSSALAASTSLHHLHPSSSSSNATTPGRVSVFVSSLIPSFVSTTYSVLSKDLLILSSAMRGLRGVPWYRKSNFHIKKRLFELQQMFQRSPYLVFSGKKEKDVNILSDDCSHKCPLTNNGNDGNAMAVNCDFSSVQNIPIHLLSTHFDPMLDDSVTLANLWQGPCQLTVLNEELPHGFLNFTPTSKEAERGSNVCIDILNTFINQR